MASWVDLSDTGLVKVEFLEPEVDRLSALAKQVSALVVGPDEPAEVLLLAEVLRQAIPVHEMHRGLESVTTIVEQVGTPTPVRAPWVRLTHVLFILLGDMGWVADQSGARRVIVTLTETGLRLSHSEVGERAMAPLESRPLPPRSVILDALRPMVSGWGFSLEEEGSQVILESDS